VKHWEIVADNLSKAGWSWGCVSGVDSRGRTIFVADAHRIQRESAAEIITGIMAASSFTIRQSIRILARSCEAGKAVSIVATKRQRRIIP
jgi:hypothetical protein